MEEENNLNSKDTQNTFLKGSAWMTFGSIASRILGALYINSMVCLDGAVR